MRVEVVGLPKAWAYENHSASEQKMIEQDYWNLKMARQVEAVADLAMEEGAEVVDLQVEAGVAEVVPK